MKTSTRGRTIAKITHVINERFEPAIGQQMVLEGNRVWYVRTKSGQPWRKGNRIEIPTDDCLKQGYRNYFKNLSRNDTGRASQ